MNPVDMLKENRTGDIDGSIERRASGEAGVAAADVG